MRAILQFFLKDEKGMCNWQRNGCIGKGETLGFIIWTYSMKAYRVDTETDDAVSKSKLFWTSHTSS